MIINQLQVSSATGNISICLKIFSAAIAIKSIQIVIIYLIIEKCTVM